jgi:hypothetical protein
MTVDTRVCKEAIVRLVASNPGLVFKVFEHDLDEQDYSDPKNVQAFELPATFPACWKRISKERVGCGERHYGKATTLRMFECSAGLGAEFYEDCLRAYVWDDGNEIVALSVEGE